MTVYTRSPLQIARSESRPLRLSMQNGALKTLHSINHIFYLILCSPFALFLWHHERFMPMTGQGVERRNVKSGSWYSLGRSLDVLLCLQHVQFWHSSVLRMPFRALRNDLAQFQKSDHTVTRLRPIFKPLLYVCWIPLDSLGASCRATRLENSQRLDRFCISPLSPVYGHQVKDSIISRALDSET